MDTIDIARKRSILFSARIRFSPETQPVKETAIDKIIEQHLLIAGCNGGLTLQETEKQGRICFANGTSAINRLDMQKSLERLVELNRVIVPGNLKYKLSEQAFQELSELQRLTEARFEQVVGKLFKNTEEGASAYILHPF